VDGGEVAKGGNGWWSGGEIKGESEDTADGGNGTWDVSAIDGAGVPSVGSSLGNTVEHELGGDTAVGRFDGNGFVEDSEPSLNMEGFVVAAGDAMEGDAEDVAHGNEVTFEFAVVVDDDKAAQTGLEKHMAHEEIGKGGGVGLGDSFADDKAGKVAHGSEQVGVEAFNLDVFVGNTTWFPKVGVDNVKG